MSLFDEKLRAEADSWDAANAPRDLSTCPNCALCKPAPEIGKHYVWCVAEPVLPVFASVTLGNSMSGHVGHPINLAHFDPAAPYAERLNAQRCPLFEVTF